MKCPKCQSKYHKSFIDSTQHCCNEECVLFFHEHNKVDWNEIWRKIRYSSLKDPYRWIRNRFFRRYDLIRTGWSKGSWCDKDHLMLFGMMGLLVDFIEKEEAFERVEMNYHKLDSGIPVGDFMIDLYTDWKVNYPKAQEKEAEALSAWSASVNMGFGDNEPVGDSKLSTRRVFFETVNGYTEEDRKRLLEAHIAAETYVAKLEQDMLYRLVTVRQYMWT